MSNTSPSRSPNHFQDGFSPGLLSEEGRGRKRAGFLDRHLREIRRARKWPNCAFQYGNFAIEMSGISPSLALNLFQDGFSLSLPTEKGGSIPRASELCTTVVLPYDRSTASFLREIDGGWIPREISDALPLNYIDGCIVLELRDYRESTGAAVLKEAMQANASGRSNKLGRIMEIRPKVHKLLLRPTTESVARDITLLADDSWTYNDFLEIEARVLKAVQPPVCLDPSPLVAENAAILNYNKDKFSVQRRRAQWYKFGQVNAPQQQAGGGSELHSKGGTNVPSKKQRHGKESAAAVPGLSTPGRVSSVPSLPVDNTEGDSVLNAGGKGSRANQSGNSHPSSDVNGFLSAGNGKGGKGRPKPKVELLPDPQTASQPVMSDSAVQVDSSQFLAPPAPHMPASLAILEASGNRVDSSMPGNGTETAVAAVPAKVDVKLVTHLEPGKRPREAEAALRAEAKRQKQEQARLQKIQRDLQRAQMKQEKENQKRQQQQQKQLLRAQKQQAQSAVHNAPPPFTLPPPIPPTSSAQQPQPQMQNTASQTDAIMRVRKDGAVEKTDMPLCKLEAQAVESVHAMEKHASEVQEADQGLLTCCIPHEHIGASDWQVSTENDPARQKSGLGGKCPQLWQQSASEEVRTEPLPPLSSAQLLENREGSVLDAHLPGEMDAPTVMEETLSEKHGTIDLMPAPKMPVDPKALRPDLLASPQGCSREQLLVAESGAFVSEDLTCMHQLPPAAIHEPVVGHVHDASVQHLVNHLGDMGGEVPSHEMKPELVPGYKGQHLSAVTEPSAQHADAGTQGEPAGLAGSAACQVRSSSDCQLPANDRSQLRSLSFTERQQRQEQELQQQVKCPFEVQGEAQATAFQLPEQQASLQSDCQSDKQLLAHETRSDPNWKTMAPNVVCLKQCDQVMDLQPPLLEKQQQQPLLSAVEHSSCSNTVHQDNKSHTSLQAEEHLSEPRDQGTRPHLPIHVKQEPPSPDAVQPVGQPSSIAHSVQFPPAPASLSEVDKERPCSVNQGAEDELESKDVLPREPVVSTWSEKVPPKSQTQPLVQSSKLLSAHQPQTPQQQAQLQSQTLATHQTQPLALSSSPAFTSSQSLLYTSPAPTSQVFCQSVALSKTKHENNSGTMAHFALTPIPQTPDQEMSNVNMHKVQTNPLGLSLSTLNDAYPPPPPPPLVFSQPMHTVKSQAAFAAESTVKLENVKVEKDVKMVRPVVKQEIDVKQEVMDVKAEKDVIVKVEQSVKKQQAALVGALQRSKSLKSDVKPAMSLPALSSPPPTCSSGVSTTSVGEAGVTLSIGSPRPCTVASPSLSSTVVNNSHYGSSPVYTGHNWGTVGWGGTTRTMSSSAVMACSPAGGGGQGMANESGMGLQSPEPPHAASQGPQSVEVQTESDDLGPIKAKFVKLIQFINKHIPKKPPKKEVVRKTGPAQPSWQLLQFALASNIDEGKELLASQKGLVGFGGSVNVPRLRTIRFQAPHLLHSVRLTFFCASNKDPVDAILFMEDRDPMHGYVDRVHFDLPTFRTPFAADRFASQYTALMIKDNYILVEDVIRMQGTSGITSNHTGFQAGTGTLTGMSNAVVSNGMMGIAIGPMRVQGNPLTSPAGVIANGHMQPGMGVLPGSLASSQRMPPPGTPRQLMQAQVGMPTVGALHTLTQSDAVQQQHHHHLLQQQQQQYAQQLKMQNHQMQRAQVISVQGYNSPIQLASPYTSAVQGTAQITSNQILTGHGGQPQIQQLSTLQHFHQLQQQHQQQQQQGKPYETAQQQLMLRRRAVGSGTSSLSNVAAVSNLSGYTSVPGVPTGISGVGIPVSSSGNMGGMPAIGSMNMMNGMGSVGGIPSMSGMTPVTGVLTGTLTPTTGIPAMGTAVPGTGSTPVGVGTVMRQPSGGTTGNQGSPTKRGSSQSRSRGSPNGGLGSPSLSGDSSAPAHSAPNAGAGSPDVIMTQTIGSTAATTLPVSRGNSVGSLAKGIPGQSGVTVQGTVQGTTVHGPVAAGYAYAIPQMGTMMGTTVIQPHPTVAAGNLTPYQGVSVRSRGGRQTPAPTPPAT